MPLPSGAPNAHTAARLPDPHILDGLIDKSIGKTVTIAIRTAPNFIPSVFSGTRARAVDALWPAQNGADDIVRSSMGEEQTPSIGANSPGNGLA
jgi:hypothetical protein